jgi:transcription initiation factor TFIID subunit 12
MASAQPQTKTEPTNEAANIISALGKAFKGQNGAPLTGDQLAQWLHQNMAQLGMLVKEGKLTQGQILAVRKQCRLLPLRESNSVPTLTRGPCFLLLV